MAGRALVTPLTAEMLGLSGTRFPSPTCGLSAQAESVSAINFFPELHAKIVSETPRDRAACTLDAEFLAWIQADVTEMYEEFGNVIAKLANNHCPVPYSAIIGTTIKVFTHMHSAAARHIDQGYTGAAESFEKLQDEIETFGGPACRATYEVVFQNEMQKKTNGSSHCGDFP